MEIQRYSTMKFSFLKTLKQSKTHKKLLLCTNLAPQYEFEGAMHVFTLNVFLIKRALTALFAFNI